MVVRLAVAFLAMSQPAPSPLPRLIPFVAVTPSGDIELRIDNPSPKPLDVSLIVELVLDRPESVAPTETPSTVPSYRARLDLADAVPHASESETRVQIVAKASRKWLTSAARLQWYEHRSAIPFAPRSFSQAVPPGHYSLALRIAKDQSPWWHSEEIAVTIDGTHGLTLRDNGGK